MNVVTRLVLAGIFFAVATSVSAHGTANDPVITTKAALSPPPSTAARDLTMLLLDAKARYDTAAPGTQGQILAEIIAIARDRHDELAALLDSDPAEVARVALPVDLLAGLPARHAGATCDYRPNAASPSPSR